MVVVVLGPQGRFLLIRLGPLPPLPAPPFGWAWAELYLAQSDPDRTRYLPSPISSSSAAARSLLFSSAQHLTELARGDGESRVAMAGTGCHSLLSPASPLSPEFFSRHRASAAGTGVYRPSKGESSSCSGGSTQSREANFHEAALSPSCILLHKYKFCVVLFRGNGFLREI